MPYVNAHINPLHGIYYNIMEMLFNKIISAITCKKTKKTVTILFYLVEIIKKTLHKAG